MDHHPLPDLIGTAQWSAAAMVLLAGQGALQAIPRHNQAAIKMTRKTDAKPAGIQFKVGGMGTVDRVSDDRQRPLLTLRDFRGGEQHASHRDLPTLEVATQGNFGGDVRMDAADLPRLERRSPEWCQRP